MTRPEPPTCRKCGAEFDIGRRTSQESVDNEAVKQGWILGLPHNRALCPEHQWQVEDFTDA